jgi:uncharacterized membrane protein YccF (DUF307 family)
MSQTGGVKTLLNLIWLVLAGFWLALGYVVAAVLLAITIIGLPFAKQSLKLGRYALWPFGRALVQSSTRHKGLSAVGNVLWFVLAGWWLALAHLLTGIALCLTIIGIPLGIADIKMAGAALVPFGRKIVRAREVNIGMAAESSTISFPD